MSKEELFEPIRKPGLWDGFCGWFWGMISFSR
jgi:hypothetical protein